MWRWLQPGPAAVDTSSDAVANPHQAPEAPKQRRAPYPHLKTIAGAADADPFLASAEDAPPELQASAKANLDANARYHLLALAKDSNVAALDADARTDVRYQALLKKTSEYRGELVRITGDLISMSEPMELHRKVPGMEVCYLALMTNERPDHQYLVLFTDLPPGLPKDQTQWNQLYLRQVQFAGYFYKVAKFTDPANMKKQWMLPVLVGKMPVLSEVVNEGSNWLNLFSIFLAMAIPVILISLFVPRYFKKSDAEHDSLMQRFRKRREEQITQSLEELPEKENPPLRLHRDEG